MHKLNCCYQKLLINGIAKIKITNLEMQSCSNCQNEYDAVKHVPRILISCGHTYCQVCIQMVINEEKEAQQLQLQSQKSNVVQTRSGKNQSSYSRRNTNQKREAAISGTATPQQIVFECFECGIPCQIDSKLGINSLPKNMVLISTAQGNLQSQSDRTSGNTVPETVAMATSGTRLANSSKFKSVASQQSMDRTGVNSAQVAAGPTRQLSYEESSSLINIAEDGTEVDQSHEEPGTVDSVNTPPSNSQCKLHPMKRIEAFCEKDFKLLCIDCILSDRHKNHEIVSIQKATEKHHAYLRQNQENSMSISQKLISSKNEIQRHMQLMKVQAENNRRELSVLYNAIRDLLIQREQALKTFIAEVQEREEDHCQAKISQIDEALANIEDYEENIAIALEESEIDLLRRFNERKLLVNTFNADSHIKDLQLLNVSQYGLAYGPPTVPSSGGKSKKNAPEPQNLDDQPPFQSLQEINKTSEQLQVSKMINPNFKGQVANCTGILPFTRGPEEKSSAASNNLYQQHTTASQNKVNKRTMGTSQQVEKSGQTQGGAIAAYNEHQKSALGQHETDNSQQRPYQNQSRRGGAQQAALQIGASPKPGDNKRRQNNNGNATTSVYGASNFNIKSRATNAHTLAQQQRTHSYGLSSFNHTATVHTSTQPTPALAKEQTAATSVSNKEINLFNQQKSGANNVGAKRNTVQVSSRLNTQQAHKQSGTIPLLQHVTTQRTSLYDDSSVDGKQLSQNQGLSDRQAKLKTQKQTSDSDNQTGTKTFPTVTENKRSQRANQEKLISDDLLHVQQQVNQVMSNLETFESKKRELSAQKDSRIKMFHRSPVRPRPVGEDNRGLVSELANLASRAKQGQAAGCGYY